MEITKNAIRPAREYLDTNRKFPVPKNISSLRPFYGMINQINYAFTMNEHMASLLDLVFVFVKSCLTHQFQVVPLLTACHRTHHTYTSVQQMKMHHTLNKLSIRNSLYNYIHYLLSQHFSFVSLLNLATLCSSTRCE